MKEPGDKYTYFCDVFRHHNLSITDLKFIMRCE